MNLDGLKKQIESGVKMFLRDFSYDTKNKQLTLIVGQSLYEGNATPITVEGVTGLGQIEKGYEIYRIGYYPKLECTEVHINTGMGQVVTFKHPNQSLRT
jgi:hypothetical protein